MAGQAGKASNLIAQNINLLNVECDANSYKVRDPVFLHPFVFITRIHKKEEE